MIERRLQQYLDAWEPRWHWAERNCAHFAGGWVRLERGADPLTGLDGRAMLALVRKCGGDVQRAITRRLLCEPLPPTQARIGDVLLLPGNTTGAALGLCCGRTVAVLGPHGQVVHAPLEHALTSWPLREVLA